MENISLPSPMELAKKESTRPISIRVKESTMLTFEKLAQQYSTTASAIINNLLDSYAMGVQMANTRIDKIASKKVMAQYLEKMTSRIKNLNDRDLCLNLAKNGRTNLEGLSPGYYYEAVTKGHEDDLGPITLGDWDVVFMCSGNKESTVEYYDSESLKVNIPAKMFPIVGYIIGCYADKSDALYGDNRRFLVSKTFFEQIADAINNKEYSRENFAKRLCNILIEYESLMDEKE